MLWNKLRSELEAVKTKLALVEVDTQRILRIAGALEARKELDVPAILASAADLFKQGVEAARVPLGPLAQHELTPEQGLALDEELQAQATKAVEAFKRDMADPDVGKWLTEGTGRDE